MLSSAVDLEMSRSRIAISATTRNCSCAGFLDCCLLPMSQHCGHSASSELGSRFGNEVWLGVLTLFNKEHRNGRRSSGR
jgi:hypothetical protein